MTETVTLPTAYPIIDEDNGGLLTDFNIIPNENGGYNMLSTIGRKQMTKTGELGWYDKEWNPSSFIGEFETKEMAIEVWQRRHGELQRNLREMLGVSLEERDLRLPVIDENGDVRKLTVYDNQGDEYNPDRNHLVALYMKRGGEFNSPHASLRDDGEVITRHCTDRYRTITDLRKAWDRYKAKEKLRQGLLPEDPNRNEVTHLTDKELFDLTQLVLTHVVEKIPQDVMIWLLGGNILTKFRNTNIYDAIICVEDEDLVHLRDLGYPMRYGKGQTTRPLRDLMGITFTKYIGNRTYTIKVTTTSYVREMYGEVGECQFVLPSAHGQLFNEHLGKPKELNGHIIDPNIKLFTPMPIVGLLFGLGLDRVTLLKIMGVYSPLVGKPVLSALAVGVGLWNS